MDAERVNRRLDALEEARLDSIEVMDGFNERSMNNLEKILDLEKKISSLEKKLSKIEKAWKSKK